MDCSALDFHLIPNLNNFLLKSASHPMQTLEVRLRIFSEVLERNAEAGETADQACTSPRRLCGK